MPPDTLPVPPSRVPRTRAALAVVLRALSHFLLPSSIRGGAYQDLRILGEETEAQRVKGPGAEAGFA